MGQCSSCTRPCRENALFCEACRGELLRRRRWREKSEQTLSTPFESRYARLVEQQRAARQALISSTFTEREGLPDAGPLEPQLRALTRRASRRAGRRIGAGETGAQPVPPWRVLSAESDSAAALLKQITSPVLQAFRRRAPRKLFWRGSLLPWMLLLAVCILLLDGVLLVLLLR